MPPKATGFEVLPELQDIHQRVKRGTGNHILTGPIFVRGAAVGDVLEVKILDIELRQNWGCNLFRAYMRHAAGGLPLLPAHARCARPAEQHGGPAVGAQGADARRSSASSRWRRRRISDGRTARSRASSAATSTARSSPPAARSICRCGTKAALFSTGDGHAAQGDGEVERHRDRDRARPARSSSTCARISAGGCRVRKPRRTSSPSASNADLDDAARQALREMIDWIVDDDRDFQGRSLCVVQLCRRSARDADRQQRQRRARHDRPKHPAQAA